MSEISEDGKPIVLPAEGREQEKPTKEEWEAYRLEIEKLTAEVSQKADEVLGEDGYFWMNQKIVDFTNELKINYPEYKHCIAWHRMVFSGTYYETSPLLDMPDPYNVKNFLLKLKDELNDQAKCQKYIKEIDSN